MQRLDEGRLGLGHLLVVAPPEAESVPVTAGGAVEPAGRVLAGVSEGLLGSGTQQLQEGQLHHVDGVPIGVTVGELRSRRRKFLSVTRSAATARTARHSTSTRELRWLQSEG